MCIASKTEIRQHPASGFSQVRLYLPASWASGLLALCGIRCISIPEPKVSVQNADKGNLGYDSWPFSTASYCLLSHSQLVLSSSTGKSIPKMFL